MDLHPARLQERHQVVQDAVHRSLVEDLLVSEPVDVELERLELDQLAVGNIPDVNRREIREA